jgi:hypothetical protein
MVSIRREWDGEVCVEIRQQRPGAGRCESMLKLGELDGYEIS